MKTSITILAVVLSAISSTAFGSYPRAGYEAELSTLFHDVSGTVTIVDHNTIVVEDFNYDGQGPAVYFYLGADNNDAGFTAGLRIGPLLTGPVYDHNELIVQLAGPNTVDSYKAISVWCEDFYVNFGSGVFIDTDPYLSWTFGNQSSQSYKLDAFSPNDVPFGTITTEDPNLLLHLNKRYRVTVTNYASHPFEVLAKGASSGSDTVLLSMKTDTGVPLENDAEIGWTDDGSGTAEFTLTQALYDSMTTSGKNPGYRCGIHVSTMRGDFNVCLEELDGDINGDCKVDLFDLALLALDWAENKIGL